MQQARKRSSNPEFALLRLPLLVLARAGWSCFLREATVEKELLVVPLSDGVIAVVHPSRASSICEDHELCFCC